MINKFYTKDPLLNILEYIFMIITVLQCNSIYLYFPQSYINKASVNLLWQLLLFILIIIYSYENKNLNNIEFVNFLMFFFIFFVLMSSLILYNFIIYPSFQKNYVIKLLVDPILLLIYFYCINNLNKIEKIFIDFENVVLWISIISLPLLLFYALGIPTTSVKFSEWGGSQVENGYFNLSFFAKASKSTFLGIPWIRNSSMFAEPSMFAYVLIIALLVELFIRDTNGLLNYRIIILLVTVISTSSTTGIITSLVSYVYYILLSHGKQASIKFLFILIIPIIFILIKYILVEKLNTGINDSSIRFDDISAGVKTWKDHIILGCGLGKKSLIQSNMASWRQLLNFSKSELSDSAGFPVVLAQGGLIWGLFYVLPSIIVSRLSYKLLGLALFSFIPLIFVVSQGFYIYLMLLMYFWYVIIMGSNNIRKGLDKK